MRTVVTWRIAWVAVVLALAGAGLTSASAQAGVTRTAGVSAGSVVLVVHGAAARAGQGMRISVVNGTSRRIAYRPCFGLARLVGSRWHAMTGIVLPRACPRMDVVQQPHARRQWTLILPRDLSTARYRVTLPYRSGRRHSSAYALVETVGDCVMPLGAVIVANDQVAMISRWSVPDTQDTAYLGCTRSTGQVHVLDRLPGGLGYNDTFTVPSLALTGDDAALGIQYEDNHYGGTSLSLFVYDLRTGRRIAHHGGSLADCSGNGDFAGCGGRVHTVVVNAQGDAAADFSYLVACPATMPPLIPGAPCTEEQINASDSSGLHSVDTAVDPYNGGLTFSSLTLTGQTLSWDRSGVPQSMTLH